MKYALGIDIGGTNIKGLAVTPKGRVLSEMNMATEDSGGKKWLANVKLASDRTREGLREAPAWIGLAAPGIAAPDQRSISYMPERLPGLEGLVWRSFFRTTDPVPILNDAKAALLGEVWCGAAVGATNAILLTLGTGVGGAALVDGRLLRGHIGRAGHLGHISLDPAGPRDITGTPGSLEDAIGGCTLKSRTNGCYKSTQDLIAASQRKDPVARTIWLKSVQALAAAIASLINILDPEVVIIGGGIAKAGPALFRPLKENLGRFEWRPGGRRTQIVAARLGDRAGAFGAAWNALHFQKQNRHE
jgi:glucokinase